MNMAVSTKVKKWNIAAVLNTELVNAAAIKHDAVHRNIEYMYSLTVSAT